MGLSPGCFSHYYQEFLRFLAQEMPLAYPELRLNAET